MLKEDLPAKPTEVSIQLTYISPDEATFNTDDDLIEVPAQPTQRIINHTYDTSQQSIKKQLRC